MVLQPAPLPPSPEVLDAPVHLPPVTPGLATPPSLERRRGVWELGILHHLDVQKKPTQSERRNVPDVGSFRQWGQPREQKNMM